MYRRCLTLILLFAIACIGWGPATIYVKPSAGLDWSTIQLFSRMESDTMANPGDCYITDNTWTLNSGATFNAAAMKYGTNGLDIPGADDYAKLEPTADSYDFASFRTGFWMRVTTYSAAQAYTYRHGIAATAYNEFYVEADGDVTVIYDSGAGGTDLTCTTADDGGSWSADNAHHFYEIAVQTETANDDYIEVYVDGVLECSHTGQATNARTGNNLITVGDITGGTTLDYHFDNLIHSTDPTLDLYGGGTGFAAQTSCP